MHFISEETSARLVTRALAFDAARAALVAAASQAVSTFPVVLGHGTAPENRFSIKSASDGTLAGVKIGSYWPGNSARGLPRHNSVILFFDQERGRIDTVIEAGLVNAYRTAAADAVAVDHLARPDAATLAVFGTGNQAFHEVAALAEVRQIRRVLVVGRSPEATAAFCARLARAGLPAGQPAAAREACAAAEIIVTATPSRAPLFDADWVRPGTHVSAMGADGPGKQELPPALLARARLYCDDPEQSRRIGEMQHAPAEAPLCAIGAALDDPGARGWAADTVTVFDSSGLSIQDLYIARALVAAERSAAA
ncbi:ornithine cyclodeaminase family protein [Frigidibacter sp. MR17.24]|uniref:ornithine cyclodeaminase family protein n=1 Tax=Frigidibacter sp. MR17.24 TaxID=3127345 RepID=UPI003012C511